MKNALSWRTFVEYDELAINETHGVHVSIHLEARSADDLDVAKRPDMSVLFVLDISSSMAGEPLEQMLEVVDSTVGLLRASDRVGVMTFSKTSNEVIGVREANAEHLRRLRSRVRKITHKKWTNFEAALIDAKAMMPEPRDGERQVVLFLSDGYPSVAEREPEKLAEIVAGWDSISLSTLGFGFNHAPEIMESLSSTGGGQHHFISDPLVCEFEFSSALGSQQAVVASDVEVIITAEDGTEIVEILGIDAVQVDPAETCIDLSDFPPTKRHLIVAKLKVETGDKKGPKNVANIALRFYDEKQHKGGELSTDISATIATKSGSPDHKVIADRLVITADQVRRKARRLVRDGQQLGAADWLARMIDRIEESASYEGNDGSTLGEVCEDLREERELLDAGQTKKHEDYTLNNTRPIFVSHVRARMPAHLLKDSAGTGRLITLCFLSGSRAGEELPIRGVVFLGRSRAVDIVLDDEIVSRRHAQFLVYQDKQIIRDLGSQNGTFVNDEQVLTSRNLVDGDVLQFGDTLVSVLID